MTAGEATTSGPIFLVGMMGAGKSTVGQALARRLGREFIDTDAWVEAEAKRSIAEIFERDGEDAFRALEARAIGATAGRRAVVALGGGAIAQPGALERVAALGRSVYLRVSVDAMLARIGRAEGRPLLQKLSPEQRRARLEALLEERESAYAAASVEVETDGSSVAEVVERIVAALGGEQELE